MNTARRKTEPAGRASSMHVDGIGDASVAKDVATGGGCLLLHCVHAYGTSQLYLVVTVWARAARCLSNLNNIRTAN